MHVYVCVVFLKMYIGCLVPANGQFEKSTLIDNECNVK